MIYHHILAIERYLKKIYNIGILACMKRRDPDVVAEPIKNS